MDRMDPELILDTVTQASEMLKNQENVFLEASEEIEPNAVVALLRFNFILQKMVRGVQHEKLQRFLGDIESFLQFCVNNFASISLKEKEIFIDLYDELSDTFKRLSSDPDAQIYRSRLFERFDALKKSVETTTKSLSFNLGEAADELYSEERNEIQKLAQDLNVLQKGAQGQGVAIDSLKHLEAISARLSSLATKINLKKLRSLYQEVGSYFETKEFRFSFHGGEHEIDRSALSEMCKSVKALLESIYYRAHNEKQEVFFKAFKEENIKLDIQISHANLHDDLLLKFENELEAMGFQVFTKVDEYSGVSIVIDIPQALNTIEGQVVEIHNSLYALDLRYMKDCVAISYDNLVGNKAKGFYLAYQGGCIPLMDMRNNFGVEEQDLTNMHAIVLEMKDFNAAIAVDNVLSRQALSLRSLKKEMPQHEYFKSICFLETSVPALLLDSKKMLLDQKANELRYSKYLEVETIFGNVAFDTDDVLEVAAFERVSMIPNAMGVTCGMLNYKGEPIMVYSLEEKIGGRGQSEHKNILICEGIDGLFGLAIGDNISIKNAPKEERYSQPALSSEINREVVKAAYFDGNKETLVIDCHKAKDFNSSERSLKKVA